MKIAALMIAALLTISARFFAAPWFDDCLYRLLQFLRWLTCRLLMCDHIPLLPLTGAC